jgi:hypothetical protein
MKRLVCYIVNMRWVGYATGHMEVKLACGQAPRFTTEATHKVTCPKCLANMSPKIREGMLLGRIN